MTDQLHAMINVRVTKAEREIILRRATARGQTMSAYIRDLVLDHELAQPRAAVPPAEQDAPRLGPDVGGWRGNKIAHLTLVFGTLEQETAYRRWLQSPQCHAAFRAWEEGRAGGVP